MAQARTAAKAGPSEARHCGGKVSSWFLELSGRSNEVGRPTIEFSGGTQAFWHAGAQRPFVHHTRSPAAMHFMRPRPLQRFVRRHEHKPLRGLSGDLVGCLTIACYL